MASLSLQHITKRYPNGFEAVKDFNLEIADKEFIIFVGPSGCGKSTTLRMIAGLEEISDGTLKIDDKVVNDVEPKDRDIAMVFQNYALYPFSHSESSYPSLAGKGVRRIFAIRFATCLIRLNLEARAVILRFFQYAFFCQNCQSSERKIQNFVRTCKTFPQSGACSLRKCFFRYAPGSNSILRDRKLQRNFLPRKKSATETLSENCG